MFEFKTITEGIDKQEQPRVREDIHHAGHDTQKRNCTEDWLERKNDTTYILRSTVLCNINRTPSCWALLV
jgi:hypothetical protein